MNQKIEPCKYRKFFWYSERLAECTNPVYCEHEIRFGDSKYCGVVLKEYDKKNDRDFSETDR